MGIHRTELTQFSGVQIRRGIGVIFSKDLPEGRNVKEWMKEVVQEELKFKKEKQLNHFMDYVATFMKEMKKDSNRTLGLLPKIVRAKILIEDGTDDVVVETTYLK